LVLRDALDRLDTVPESLSDPRLSRLYACNSYINAISLALNYDRYSEDSSPFGSLLLRDPFSITMVEGLSRTSKSIFLLLDKGEITLPAAQVMISVVVTALTVMSRILETAKFALEALRQSCNSNGKIRFKTDNMVSMSSRADSSTVELLGMCDRDFIDECLHELKMADMGDNSTLLERTIARHETPDGGVRVMLNPFVANSEFGPDDREPTFGS
jgi:hypothetical protein